MRLSDYSLPKTEYPLGMSKFVSATGEEPLPYWKKSKVKGGNPNGFSFRWYHLNHMFNRPVLSGLLCSCPSISLPEIHLYFYSVDGRLLLLLWNCFYSLLLARTENIHPRMNLNPRQRNAQSQTSREHWATDLPTIFVPSYNFLLQLLFQKWSFFFHRADFLLKSLPHHILPD